MGNAPTITTPRKTAGIAGQLSYTTTVQYPGEAHESITFVGSVYGGPVVMVTPAGHPVMVSDPGRHGEFGPEWVRRFFADRG